MGNENEGPSFLRAFQVFDDLLLVLRVQGGHGLVQNEKPWVHENHPCDGDPLFFSLREEEPSFSHLRLETLGKLFDNRMGLCKTKGSNHLLLRCIGVAESEIFP